ncbi:MAG TPA: GGDEF domain-containing protein [Albitalea sp.]
MSSSALRLLLVGGAGVAVPAVPASSPFGPFELRRADDLDAAQAALADERFDAVVIAARTVDARKLVAWPALSQAAGEPALVVLTTDPPGADLALLLVKKGAQDVLPLSIDAADALPRAIRLAIERKAQERLARKAWATDVMTGLPNQAQLVEHASQLIALREREPAPMALVVLRVEGLAATEARLGSEAAHVLRRKLAVRLRVAVRASDVVAAIGGDCFAVLLARFQDPQDAERVAAKLAAGLRPPFAVAGQHVAVAVACGVAHCPKDAGDAVELLRRASARAASAKAEGSALGASAANDS